jgi:hypothetical protein
VPTALFTQQVALVAEQLGVHVHRTASAKATRGGNPSKTAVNHKCFIDAEQGWVQVISELGVISRSTSLETFLA